MSAIVTFQLIYHIATRDVFIDEEHRPPMSLMRFYLMDDIDPPTEEMLEKAFNFRKLRLFAWCFRWAFNVHTCILWAVCSFISINAFLLSRGWKEFYKMALERREIIRKKVEQAIEKRNRKAKIKAIAVWRVSTLLLSCTHTLHNFPCVNSLTIIGELYSNEDTKAVKSHPCPPENVWLSQEEAVTQFLEKWHSWSCQSQSILWGK